MHAMRSQSQITIVLNDVTLQLMLFVHCNQRVTYSDNSVYSLLEPFPFIEVALRAFIIWNIIFLEQRVFEPFSAYFFEFIGVECLFAGIHNMIPILSSKMIVSTYLLPLFSLSLSDDVLIFEIWGGLKLGHSYQYVSRVPCNFNA